MNIIIIIIIMFVTFIFIIIIIVFVVRLFILITSVGMKRNLSGIASYCSIVSDFAIREFFFFNSAFVRSPRANFSSFFRD